MDNRRVISFIFLIVGLFASIWLLIQPGAVGQESAARQEALREALAPAAIQGGEGGDGTSASKFKYEPIEPVSVDLGAIPAGQYAPYNTYDAWQRGEIDLDETEARVSPVELLALQEEALALASDGGVQSQSAGPQAPGILTGFDALDASECCGSGTSVPPDSDLAAGPHHLIAVVNVALEIYDKSGATLLGPTTLSSFFAPLADCVAAPYGAFDPTVAYDEEADRFIVGADGNGTHFCVAVSQNGDPTGNWNMYAVPAAISGAFHDYPHIGVGQDAIYVGANQFGGTLPHGFEGRVWALDKWDMYNGLSLTPQTASTGSSEGTPQPLHLHGWQQGTWPSNNDYYFITDPHDGDTLTLWQWNNALSGAAPSQTTTFNLQTATGVSSGIPLDAPQLGGNNIQANDWRFRAFEYRNGYAWTTDSISCNPGGGTVDCVRWAQINLTPVTPTLVQAGVYGSSGVYRTFPDVAANHCNDSAVGYSKLSGSTYPGVWYTGREAGDPVGTLQAETILKAGEVTYTAFDGAPYRWGDYSGMTVDPDGVTFWYMGEYSKNVPVGPSAKWGNYIGAFAYANCTAPLPYDATLVANSAISASPGITVTHPFTLTNSGVFDDEYDLSLSGNTWTTLLQNAAPVALASGASATIFIDVGVPSLLSGSDVFTLTATSVTTPSLSLSVTGTTDIVGSAGITTSGDMMASGNPGDVVTYTVAVTNTGDVSDAFDVAVSGNSWLTTVAAGSTGMLASGAGTTVDFYVTVGSDAVADTATATFTSTVDGNVTADVKLTTKLAQPYGMDLGPNSAITAAPGVTVTHAFTLTNMGVLADDYGLAVGGNSWTTALQTGSPVFLAGGAAATIYVDVGIPSILSGGDVFTLTATSVTTPSLSMAVVGTTAIVGSAGVATSGDDSALGDPGDTITYTIAVTNTGVIADAFSIALSGYNWPTTSSVANTGMLAPGTSTSVGVTVTVGSDAIADVATVTFTSAVDSGLTADVALSTRLATPYDATLGANSVVNAAPGVTATHVFTLTNAGVLSDSYDLTVNGGAWTTLLQTVTPVALPGGTSATIAVDVSVPLLSTGSDVFTLTATSVTTPSLMLAATGTTIVASAGIATSGDVTGAGSPGTTVTHTIVVTNTGNIADSFTVALGSANWPTTVSQVSTGSLAPGASATVSVTVTIPYGAASDLVTVTFTSALDSNVEAEVAVTTTSTHPFALLLPVATK